VVPFRGPARLLPTPPFPRGDGVPRSLIILVLMRKCRAIVSPGNGRESLRRSGKPDHRIRYGGTSLAAGFPDSSHSGESAEKITAALVEKAVRLVTRRAIQPDKVELKGPIGREVLVKISSCGARDPDEGGPRAGTVPPSVLEHGGAGVAAEAGSGTKWVGPSPR
jgi:hypothetical protein